MGDQFIDLLSIGALCGLIGYIYGFSKGKESK